MVSQENEQKRKSPVRSGQGDSQVALAAARPHGTPRDARGAEGSRGLPHLAFGPAGLGLGPAGLHRLGHTLYLRDVAVCFCQTPAIHASRPVPASWLSRDRSSTTRAWEAATGAGTDCDLEQTSRGQLARGRSRPFSLRPSPSPALAPPSATPWEPRPAPAPAPLAAGWHSELPFASTAPRRGAQGGP